MIQSKLKEFDFISSFTVRKIYPKTLKIKITEKKPIAILDIVVFCKPINTPVIIKMLSSPKEE